MSDFITLSCPSCGNKLQITDDIDRFACSACGNEHIVKRSGGIVTLKPVLDGIKRVQVGVDKTASELAIVRLTKEIEELKKNIKTISAQKIDNDSPRVEFSKYGVYFLLIVGFITFVISLIDFLLVGLLIGLICFILGVYFYLYLRRRKKIEREWAEFTSKKVDDKVTALENLINDKEIELSAHKEIVSKND